MAGSSKLRIPPWRSLTDAQTRSHAAGRAEVPTSLAGRALALVEWVRGEGAVDNEAPGIQRNPQGLWGHDHSGPPYGIAFRHPVACVAGGGTDWTRRATAGAHPFASPEVGGATGKVLIVGCTFWMRPFSQWDKAPHSRAFVRLRASNTGAGSTTLSVKMTQPDGQVQTGSVTVSSTTITVFTLATPFLRCEPGENLVRLEFSNSSSSIVTRLRGISMGQAVPRTH